MSYKLVSPLPIIEGGTGVKLTTPYAVICGGTTNTGPLQFIASVGTSGQVLTSNGAGALPTFQTGVVGEVDTLTGNSGGAIAPLTGNINVVGDGTGITIVGSGHTLTASLVSGSAFVETLTGSTSGGAISPSLGNINITAGTGITVVGTANTLTISATSLGDVTELTGNTGGAIMPVAGNINVVGDGTTVAIAGSGHTLTASVVSGIVATSFTGNTGGPESPLLGNFNIVGDGTTITIAGTANTLTASLVGTGAIQTLTGSTSGGAISPLAGNINITAGTGITVIGTTNTLTIATTGIVATSFPTDSGTATPSSGVINILADTASQHAGSTVSFSGSGNTVLFNVTDANSSTIIGYLAGNALISGTNNTALGAASLHNLSNGTSNTALGLSAGFQITSGSFNTFIGQTAGNSYTSSESSNINIGYATVGTVGESHVLRIGSGTGTSSGQLNKAFISGIDGVNVGSTANVVTEVGNQLGTAVITAGSGITITPGANTITIAASGGGSGLTSIAGDDAAMQTGPAISLVANATAGSSVSFTGLTNTISLNVTDANRNTLIGKSSGIAGITGQFNIGLGAFTGASLTSGALNTMIGDTAGILINSGARNTLVGNGAGFNYTVETDNIILGSSIFGMVGESNVLRIGASTGSGGGQLLQSFIAGIYGISVATADGIPVYVGSGDQLGTIASTKRVKHSIEDMNDTSSAILNLRPVTFVYNGDTTEKKQYGLIAEEVNEIFPGLVACNKNGEIETVLYHVLPAMLLNEIKKLNARITALEAKL